MILFANALLGVPLVKLVGAWTLIVIALNVRAQSGAPAEGPERAAGASDFLSAAVVIMFADAAMSLDNVVALAAIAGGNLWLLAIGVLLSIPILVYGAYLLTGILRLAPEIFIVGAAFLGWIAGGMAATDPLVVGLDRRQRAGARRFRAGARGAVRACRRTGRARSGQGPRRRQLPPASCRETSRPAERAKRVDPPAVAARARSFEPTVASSPADDAMPGFASDEPQAASGPGWTEERIVVAGFVVLAFLAGLIIFVASFYDSLT